MHVHRSTRHVYCSSLHKGKVIKVQHARLFRDRSKRKAIGLSDEDTTESDTWTSQSRSGQGQGRGLTPASASGPLAPAADRVRDRSRFLLSTEDPELSQGLTPSRNLDLRLQGRLCQGQGQDLQMGRRRVQGLDREQGIPALEITSGYANFAPAQGRQIPGAAPPH
ncbi:hypothetical protein C0Q70_00493 [Pomacea canaliculata]|uniref:Uncharacterized protein n=1 Tax=Pomacea canaliculata TaxID=400727 RepID=A0A2T7PWT5_POMCA|nr:hypothetical protein C0Q70_00493 [Pomacea canaliculata]